MTISVDGLKEVLDILKGLFGGLKSAAAIPEANRKEMRSMLADTVELVDQTLTILKRHLTTILSTLKFDNESTAHSMIAELGSFPFWEERYRSFQLLEALQASLDNIQRLGVFAASGRSETEAKIIYQQLQDHIGGTNAARAAGTMLKPLSGLADTKYARDDVASDLEIAKKTLMDWQQKFIDLEQQVRSLI